MFRRATRPSHYITPPTSERDALKSYAAPVDSHLSDRPIQNGVAANHTIVAMNSTHFIRSKSIKPAKNSTGGSTVRINEPHERTWNTRLTVCCFRG